MDAIEKMIIAKLKRGPLYARTFHLAKPVVNRLVARGIVKRIAPPGSKSKNMLALVADHD